MKGQHLVGVFFPNAGGVPELPKATICGMPTAGMPPQMLQLLLRMNEQQQRALTNIQMPQRMEAIKALAAQYMKATAGGVGTGADGNGVDEAGGGNGVPGGREQRTPQPEQSPVPEDVPGFVPGSLPVQQNAPQTINPFIPRTPMKVGSFDGIPSRLYDSH